MTDAEIHNLFTQYFNDIPNLANMGQTDRPLLAHYTSIDVLEKIIKNQEIWFSHPLFMNDTQEMSYGMIEGLNEFKSFIDNGELLKVCGTKQRYDQFINEFDNYVNRFNERALEVFIFCLSQHDISHEYGRL